MVTAAQAAAAASDAVLAVRGADNTFFSTCHQGSTPLLEPMTTQRKIWRRQNAMRRRQCGLLSIARSSKNHLQLRFAAHEVYDNFTFQAEAQTDRTGVNKMIRGSRAFTLQGHCSKGTPFEGASERGGPLASRFISNFWRVMRRLITPRVVSFLGPGLFSGVFAVSFEVG